MIFRCQSCGHFQKRLDDAVRRTIEWVYASYNIYPLGGGSDLPVQTRLGAVLDNLGDIFADSGRMLDVGCGTGAFLQCWRERFPRWGLNGFDIQAQFANRIAAIPGVERFSTLYPKEDRNFDFITSIHSLEHAMNPDLTLREIASCMGDQTLLMIQVPDVGQDLLDFLVYDHVSFFTADTLFALLARHFPFVAMPKAQVRNEVTLLAARQSLQLPESRFRFDPPEYAPPQLERLARIEAQLLNLEGPVAVMGVANDGVYVAGVLGARAAYFVDDDATKHGKRHVGLEVRAPADADPAISVYLPFEPALVHSIRERHSHLVFIDMVP